MAGSENQTLNAFHPHTYAKGFHSVLCQTIASGGGSSFFEFGFWLNWNNG